MKMQLTRCLAVVFIFIPLTARGQSKCSKLMAVEEKLVRSLSESKPTWKHEETRPIEGSADVAIHRWVSEDVSVRVTIVRYSSVEKAQESISDFAHHMRSTNAAREDGDEAYSIAGRNNSIVI